MRLRNLLGICIVMGVALSTFCSTTVAQENVIGYLSNDEPTAGDEVFIGTPVLDEFGDPLFDDDDNIIREGGFFAEHYPDYDLRFLGACVHPDFLTCEDLGIDADDGLYSLFFVGESISSSRADGLIETSIPVIINEQFAYDNWGLTGDNTNHGPPGTENDNGVQDGGSLAAAEIQIVDDQHPIAVGAGLSNGNAQVYDPDGTLIWGSPGAGADVVAVIPGFDDFDTAAAIFVYEQGDTLANGEEAFGMRIGTFLSDIAGGSTGENEGTLLTDTGLGVMKSIVDFALGLEPDPPAPTVPVCEPSTGDFDGNGKVEFADFLVLSNGFGQAGGAAQGDADCNGQIEFADFLILSSNFGQDVAATSVPEPNGLVLVSFGLMLITATRRRR